MKNQIKKDVTSKDVREYLTSQGIDQKKLVSLNRMTVEGREEIANVIQHFSDARPYKAGIRLELNDEVMIETGGLGEIFDTTAIIDIDSIRDRINQAIDFRNYVVERTKEATPALDQLTEHDKAELKQAFEKGNDAIDHLNEIIKEKKMLHFSDLQIELLEPIIDMRLKARELMAKGKARLAELEKLKKRKEQLQDQEPER